MINRYTFSISLLVAALFTGGAASAGDFTEFRGSGGQGHAEVKTAPLKWSANAKNIAWKTPIDGLGWSSPVVKGDDIWLTTAVDGGRSLRLLCLNASDGKVKHDVELFKPAKPGRIHKKNSHASPTPIVSGDRVYAHFGSEGTACVTTSGEIVWKHTFKYRPVHGPGGSPVLFEDLLIVNCDGGDVQFVAALDTKSGDVRWKTKRPPNTGKKFAFSTPLIVDVNGAAQLISPGAGGVVSYQPRTGKQIWQFAYPGGYSVTPRPVHANGVVYVSSSFDRPALFAIRTSGKGDVTQSHQVWKATKGAPHSPSPLLAGDNLYMVSDRGILTCADAKTGDVKYTERLTGNFSASPVYAAGRLYCLNETGEMSVVAAGDKFEVLATNTLPGGTLASPAFIEGAMLLRTSTHLYRIEAEK